MAKGTTGITPDALHRLLLQSLAGYEPTTPEDKRIVEFIAAWPDYIGGWLIYHCGLLNAEAKRAATKDVMLYLHTDKNNSVLSVLITGLPPFALPGFCDFFIQKKQFIWFSFEDKYINTPLTGVLNENIFTSSRRNNINRS